MMNTGSLLGGRPSLGAWVNYGLGSENQNLPGFVVLLDNDKEPRREPRVGNGVHAGDLPGNAVSHRAGADPRSASGPNGSPKGATAK